ncbi:MAG: filamentous hemagglutinin N-terminal domain-containing protein, partial [Phycisphaerae bacterium]
MKIARRLQQRYFKQSFLCITACWVLLNMSLPVAQATPTAAEVVAGSAAVVQADNTTNVQMVSNRAVISWDSLDTSYNETLNFLKESNFAVLNRVITGGPTRFDGSLFAENGSVFIVNTQGLVFGPTAYIQANEFVGSSLDITNTDFMNGQYTFAGGNGAVVNQGDITAQSVALIGKRVLNAGIITSPEGYVVMAAGDRVLLGKPGESIFVEVDSAGVLEPMDTPISDLPADVTNEGLIKAENGTIVLAAGDSFSRAVANIGTLSTAAGKIKVDAARIENMGTINADAIEGDGGSISLTATEEVVLGAGSLTTANAGANGDGGKVIVQSEGTAILSKGSLIEAKGGSESGNGGFVEISGDHFVFAGDVDASAVNGKFGTLLIDPDNIVVKDGDGTNTTDTLYEEQLETQLADIFLLADESIIMEDLTDNELDADTRNVTFQTTGTDSFISFHQSDTISTTTGNIVIESGGGGINIGSLETGKDGGRDKVPSGKITVTTEDGGDIITRDLRIRSGWGSAEIDVDASGSLTIDGDVSVGKKGAAILNVPNGADAQATIRLSAGEDVVLKGDVGAYAHGKEDSLPGGVTTADVRIYAGTNETTSGNVFINGDLTAMAKASKKG